MKNSLTGFAISALFLVFLVFAAANGAAAQTTLVAGDIAFTGYISTNATDEFSFVLLKSVTAGTTINFTDNSWLNTNVFRSGEQNITWTATTALPAGTEVWIAGTTPSTGSVSGTALSLSTSGDQVLAFQGTVGAPTFISGIHMNVYAINNFDPVDTTAAAWDSTNSNNTSASALPTGLATGTNALWVGVFQQSASEFDNARFTCGSAPINTAAAARVALNNQLNWTKTNTTAGFTLPTGCAYLAPSAAEVSLTGRVQTFEGRGITGAIVTLRDEAGAIRSSKTNSFGFYRFAGLEAGRTYVLEIQSKRFQFGQPTQVIAVNEDLTEVNFTALP